MSFTSTPLGQGRRLDHHTFLNKPNSNHHRHPNDPSRRAIPTSYAYGCVTFLPLYARIELMQTVSAVRRLLLEQHIHILNLQRTKLLIRSIKTKKQSTKRHIHLTKKPSQSAITPHTPFPHLLFLSTHILSPSSGSSTL